MTGVRSKRLGAARLPANSPTTLYSCPSGKTTLLKSVYARNVSGTQQQMLVAVALAGGTATYVNVLDEQVASAKSVHWEGWLALGPGDAVQGYASGGEGDFWISGAELPDSSV